MFFHGRGGYGGSALAAMWGPSRMPVAGVPRLGDNGPMHPVLLPLAMPLEIGLLVAVASGVLLFILKKKGSS